ncbi:hypothetical protein HAL013_11520 [Helicobacter ailurogastricus]|uniref:Uncharacterized protein n=1 Tax=Helicobacter ailurogastricus TaxID=1578720 RepID=A0A0K2XCF3_9HELI|nr:hypothetical protein HAL011_16740 [Helicobacter ailurogastricus]CRF42935.1 hypothetical protein HAL013_11520 [Helicobacter ailurogastricus]CRF45005.1 hypothetical protein HAL09_16370 [Helicobacter ailurogastricus]
MTLIRGTPPSPRTLVSGALRVFGVCLNFYNLNKSMEHLQKHKKQIKHLE